MSIVTIQHIRALGYCSRGSRRWFKDHGLDWNNFISNGIDSQILLDIGDSMAKRAVEYAESNVIPEIVNVKCLED